MKTFRRLEVKRALPNRNVAQAVMWYGSGHHGGCSMSAMDLLFGRPLSSSEERGERLGPGAGSPVLGLDALSSAAYGPEAGLTLLIVLGTAGIAYIVPITISIIILLVIVYFSYRQTIESYPNGGGSYTVAGQNLGPFAGLLAAAHDRLRFDGSSGNFSGRWRACLGCPISRAPHTATLPRHPAAHYAREFTWRPRNGSSFHDSDVPLRGDAPDHARDWNHKSARLGRTSHTGGPSSAISCGNRRAKRLAAAQIVCQRMYRDDGSGSGQQWSDCLPRSCWENRPAHAD